MNKILMSILIFFLPLYLFADNKPKEIVKNIINKQEQIVSLVEEYLMSGDNVNLKSGNNKYFIDRETLSEYFIIESDFFKNISNEECNKNSKNFCTNNGGLKFELVERNGHYTGVRFLDKDVFGKKCLYCNNIFFKNYYKNVISGTRIKMVEVTNENEQAVFYPFRRTILDLFIKTDNFYMMYGDILHIGDKEPKDIEKIWVDIRGSKAIERYWFKDTNQWLEKNSNDGVSYLNNKNDLLTLPRIDGAKAIVLTDTGFTSYYSYNSGFREYCQDTNPTGSNYDLYCGWLKVIKGMDDFDFIIKGVDLGNSKY